MNSTVMSSLPNETEQMLLAPPAPWLVRATVLWKYRRVLARVTAIALILSLVVAFVIPKRYKAIARIMPPDQQGGSGAMLLAALAGRSGGSGAGAGALGGLGSLASLFAGHPSTALYESLLESGTVAGHLMDRFHLQKVYHSKYRFTTAKHLARLTTVTDDKKSGVITLAVEDTDPVRARDLAQAYLDELNNLLTRTSTSSAHRERMFIESRLRSAGPGLEQAQLALSEFASKNSAIDIKEQTRGLVDAGARLQGELLVERSGLQSLRQIYGDGNVRVRETEARIAALQQDLQKMTGSSAPLASPEAGVDHAAPDADDKGELYPPLRQLPRLAVPYADLYRQVRVQETVFELLTQQYEIARIEEAKDVPAVTVIDPPGVPERKSFPPRLLLALLLTFLSFATASALILMRENWSRIDPADPRKKLAEEVLSVVRRRVRSVAPGGRGGA
jgi:capsule polysaccharide export protein KpsE/RkpR